MKRLQELRYVNGIWVKSLTELLRSVVHDKDLNGELYGKIKEENRQGFWFEISWGYPEGAERWSHEVAIVDECKVAGSYEDYLKFMGVEGI